MRFLRGRGIAVAVCLLASSFILFAPAPVAAYTPHAPIAIYGNAGFNATNGVSGGSGTESDPYVIENWEIDGAGSATGILVTNTTAYLVIRDIYVHGAGEIGIYLAGAPHSRVEHVTASGNKIGVFVQASDDVLVARSNLSSNQQIGVYVSSSQTVSIVGNDISGNGGVEVSLWESRDAIVHHNNVRHNNPAVTGATDAMGNGNSWDAGYPSGGNYWSSYTGPDNCSGPGQDDCSAPDGLGDVPLAIGPQSQDRYPLVRPFIPTSTPVASLALSPSSGDVSTVFTLDASLSWDLDSPANSLEIRWDWEGDGEYDTSWSTEKTAQHQYTTPGVFAVRVEVRDPDGNTNTTARNVTVSASGGGSSSLWLFLSASVAAAAILGVAAYARMRHRKEKRGRGRKRLRKRA